MMRTFPGGRITGSHGTLGLLRVASPSKSHTLPCQEAAISPGWNLPLVWTWCFCGVSGQALLKGNILVVVKASLWLTGFVESVRLLLQIFPRKAVHASGIDDTLLTQ